MAHFAKIEKGVVTQVVVVDNSHEAYGSDYLNSLGLKGTWVQTSYNANFGGKFAAIGDSYDSTVAEFYPPKPDYASWTFDRATWVWVAPKPMPLDDCKWDESLQEWVLN